MKTLIFALSALLLVPGYLWASSVEMPKEYEFSINLVTFKGTGWDRAGLQKQIESVNAVFAQCHVRLKQVKVYDLDYQLPDDIAGREHYAPNGVVKIRQATREVPSPAVYLVGKMSDSSGFTKAVMRINAPPCEPELENTIWLPAVVNTPEYQNGRHTRPFATLAHELTHLLTLEGQHNGDQPPNQLSIWKYRTDLLTEEMCQQMTESPFVQELHKDK